MSNTTLASRLAREEFALGAVVHFHDPVIVELIALAGYDWASFTLEHDNPTVTDMLAYQRSADVHGLTTLLHVPGADDPRLLALLHTGIGGVVLQQAQGKEDVEELIRVSTFPPSGRRGAHGGMRADRYGVESYDDFMGRVNANLTMAVAIEDVDGVEKAEEILAVEGVGIAFVGLHDLSHSLGVPNQLGHPSVLEALAQVRRVASSRGIPVGLPGYAHSVAELQELGAQLAVSPGNDMSFVRQALAAHVERARAESRGG